MIELYDASAAATIEAMADALIERKREVERAMEPRGRCALWHWMLARVMDLSAGTPRARA